MTRMKGLHSHCCASKIFLRIAGGDFGGPWTHLVVVELVAVAIKGDGSPVAVNSHAGDG